jgi:hypothetical protein
MSSTSRRDEFTGAGGTPIVRVSIVVVVVLLTLSVAAEIMHVAEPDAGKWSERTRAATYERALAGLIERTDVVDAQGEIVGFIRAADLLGDIFETPAEIAGRAGMGHDRTPVWGYDDETLVGYMIVDVGYRSLAELGEK